MTDRSGALATARRLMRGFKSAPDPIRQARTIHQTLSQVRGLSPAQHALVQTLGRLLDARPNVPAIEAACRRLMGTLPVD